MVFMDNASGKVLHYYFVTYETNERYRMGVNTLGSQFSLQSITCDGRKGLLGSFGHIPTQLCHFHQLAIIRRYLTKKPRHIANQELWVIARSITRTNQTAFSKALNDWYHRHKSYLNQRSVSDDGKSRYTHKRLRSAYHSLKRNLPYLFVYQQGLTYQHNTPNTTNKLEGLFSHLKQSLRCHQGLIKSRKQKFIISFLQAYT